MKLQQSLQSCLEDWTKISGLTFGLLSDDNTFFVQTGEFTLPQEGVLAEFRDGSALCVSDTNYSIYKVRTDGLLRYLLFIRGSHESLPTLAQLAVCQVESLLSAYAPKEDKASFMQRLLLGDIKKEEILSRAKSLKISPDAYRVVFNVETKSSDEGALPTIRNIFSSRAKDFILPMGDASIIVVRELQPMEYMEQMTDVAKMLIDMLGAEAMISASVSYSGAAMTLTDLPRAYQEAKTAMEIGKIFVGHKNIYAFSKLGIGRLIYHLPREVCEMFVDEIFGARELSDLDENTLSTIRLLFENNLNLSETSRRLYVHRNTLVYRFEKLEKRYGLDLRQFEDAVTFKIGMMVIEYLHHQTLR